MTNPTIEDAKKQTRQSGFDGVIILAITDSGGIAGVSYGRDTKKRCDEMGVRLKTVMDALGVERLS